MFSASALQRVGVGSWVRYAQIRCRVTHWSVVPCTRLGYVNRNVSYAKLFHHVTLFGLKAKTKERKHLISLQLAKINCFAVLLRYWIIY